MPRKALVSKEDAIKTIEKFIEHFRTDDLPKFTSQVWIDMSKDLNQKWSAHGVYVAVRENRREILSTARKNQGIIMPSDDENETRCPSGSSSSVASKKKKYDIESQIVSHLKAVKTWLYLTLDGEVWEKVKPKTTFKNGQKQDKYEIRTPTAWTEAIFDAFTEEFRFPCAYILKRAKVHDSRDSLYYMEIWAECKSKKCSNRFLAFVEKEPWYGEPLDMKIKTWDTSVDEHEIVYRPVRAMKRQIIEEEFLAEEMKNCKKRAAKKFCSEHKIEQPDDDDQFEIEDPTVVDLASNVEDLMAMYNESIQMIGIIPFQVIYTTPRQMHAFNEYCNAEEWSSIKIEMKKDLIKKIRRNNTFETKDVFLLSMIFNFNSHSFMANQMITERIDYIVLRYWLGTWLSNGAKIPKEVISNYCRVFLSALCSTFNEYSLESYIHRQFAILSGSESSDYEWLNTPPRTWIRVDTQNLRNVISQWRCFDKVNHPCIREFYIRCVDLLIEAQHFHEFTELLSLTIIVAYSAREDALLESKKSSPRTIRKKLETIIAKNNKNHEIPDFQADNHTDYYEPVLEDVFVNTEQLKPITMWIEAIVKDAKSLKSQGTELNAFYLPEFADNLVSMALDFPLWTRFTNTVAETCTRHVDQYFHEWEPRILAGISSYQQFPLRADHFIKTHLDEINEAASNFESMITNFNVERVSADGKLRIKYSGKNVEVTMLRNKASASFTQYVDCDKNHTNTSSHDDLTDEQQLQHSDIQSNQNSTKKTINKDNILSACIVETDELGVCHRRNISLDFSEL